MKFANSYKDPMLQIMNQCGGNPYDAVSLAEKSALYATQIPSIKKATMDGYQHELELSDDPYDTKRLNTENIPCVLTLMKEVVSWWHVANMTLSPLDRLVITNLSTSKLLMNGTQGCLVKSNGARNWTLSEVLFRPTS
ncbi:exosome complex component RRP42-like [Daphnia pulex]|uniref:exosome complex component RRP42-like n=1 Tax=Daphnia pulex TaxID=6669 RepID=UPI001EDCCDFC|nr:exosome complex component RRP42-like [Daphnia pulex]XP_046652050.1 exosome complex component RRP42-like [Daphnia pulicaria]XP_046652051.1 exosome complex component RRP42-like [Daphnia pulicaria]